MKKILAIITTLIFFSLACSVSSLVNGASQPQAQEQTARESEHRCGDGVCDGPEKSQTCASDCAVSGGAQNSNPVNDGNSRDPQDMPDEEQTPADEQSTQAGEIVVGVVEAEINLDRTPGTGDCGVEPWYSADCTKNMKIWWEMHLKARAYTPVLIVPDGQDRWVITNQPETAQKYQINLDDYRYAPYTGEYTEAIIQPESTNPECSASLDAPDFDFQVMGTREEGLTVLVLSANPVEYAEGSCGQAKFEWDTQHLLYGWAYSLTRDATNLSFQMNDTFLKAPGTYEYEVEVDTNPSPEKRDHVYSRLSLLCMGQEADHVRAPMACPWEK